MNSDTPKVLHSVLGRSMLDYIIEAVRGSKAAKIYIVVGFKADMIIESFNSQDIEFVIQKERLGTAHAALQATSFIHDFDGDCLILCGDTPLVQSQTLERLYNQHCEKDAALTLLTAFMDDPTGYGRILRDENKRVIGIVEEKDASSEQKKIKEINTGVYCFNYVTLCELLKGVKRENQQAEYYLTDCIFLAREKGIKISDLLLTESDEIIGINSREELARVNNILRQKKLSELMHNGVTILDPNSVYIDHQVTVDRDTKIYPFVVIEGKSVIGPRCLIYPFTYLKDVCIQEGKIVGNPPVPV